MCGRPAQGGILPPILTAATARGHSALTLKTLRSPLVLLFQYFLLLSTVCVSTTLPITCGQGLWISSTPTTVTFD